MTDTYFYFKMPEKHIAKVRTFCLSPNKANKKGCFITCFRKIRLFVKAC